MLTAVATFLAAFIAFPTGAAAGTLDQSQTNFNASLAFGGQRRAAQTFTAGLSGNVDQVDLHLRRYAPPMETCIYGSGATVEIRTITGAVPSDTTLATASFPAAGVSDTFGFVSVPFTAPTAVTAGTSYALVLSAPSASCTGGFFPFEWGAATGNPYAAGALFAKLDAGSAWTAQGPVDAAFKTYVVGPPPAPPPTPPDTDPPETVITKGAADKTAKSSVKFKFTSDEAGSTFQCKLDKKPWKVCSSPRKARRLDEGKHKFKVRAMDAAGNVDATAAKDRFEIVA